MILKMHEPHTIFFTNGNIIQKFDIYLLQNIVEVASIFQYYSDVIINLNHLKCLGCENSYKMFIQNVISTVWKIV